MRRKTRSDRQPSGAFDLGPDSLRTAPVDDPSMPYPLRKKQHERWIGARAEWVARRKEHALTFGWPGGDAARALEEDAAHPISDAPFDPVWEVAHGDL